MDVSIDFSSNVTEDFIMSMIPTVLHNLMKLNNSLNVDGVNYPAAVGMIFERDVPRTNGSMISVDNITACMCVYLSFDQREPSFLIGGN